MSPEDDEENARDQPAIQLLQGDCLQIMPSIPDGSVNLILTDPPYGIDFQSNHRRVKHRRIAGDVDLFWLDNMTDEMFRILSNDSAGYVFCSFNHIDKFKVSLERRFTIKNLLVWEKNNTGMGDLTADFAPNVEFIFLIHKGRREINGSRDQNIFRFRKTGNDLHPTQKPVDLCAYLISKFSDEGDTVFDLFMGSGTTGVACKHTGRKFIGIELDPGYFNIAKSRIDGASGHQRGLFD